MDYFYLYDTDLCRAFFSSDRTKSSNLSDLEYESSQGRLGSETYQYAKERIESWYKKEIKGEKKKKKEKKVVPLYMKIGYL